MTLAGRTVTLVPPAAPAPGEAWRVLVVHDGQNLFDDVLELWSGEPLSDFATEQWAIAEAARLVELWLAAVTERAQVALALGRHGEVVGDLEPVVAGDPTLEPLVGLLMIALYRSGRQAEALEVYTRTREVLDETLGLSSVGLAP